MSTLTLELDLPEINQILSVLGDQPYKDVFRLIAKIQRQANAQIEGPTPLAAPDTAPAPPVPVAGRNLGHG